MEEELVGGRMEKEVKGERKKDLDKKKIEQIEREAFIQGYKYAIQILQEGLVIKKDGVN